MYRDLRVVVIIPALNEEQAIGKVVSDLVQLGRPSPEKEPAADINESIKNNDQRTKKLETCSPWIDQIIVCDNGSTDNTATVAESAGAIVVRQDQPGYGIACLTAMAALPSCDVVLFVDGDDSCFISQAESLLEGIYQGADLTIGSRVLGKMESGALTPPQKFGNQLSVLLIALLWKVKITDLGPFRAIRKKSLDKINMQDESFGWTVEMQIKAIQYGLDMREYPVDSKVRIGQSKISGTLKGVIGAGKGILGTIAKMRLQQGQIGIAGAELKK